MIKQYDVFINLIDVTVSRRFPASSPKEAIEKAIKTTNYTPREYVKVKNPDTMAKDMYEGGYFYARAVDVVTGKHHEYLFR